jgi:hypothetical protein
MVPAWPAMLSVVKVSAGFARRSIDSPSLAWAMRRTAARPLAQSGKKIPTKRSAAGARVTRTLASVNTPSRPSEPSTHSRRSGPAADAGKVGSIHSPSGVCSVPPANSCSMRP